MMIITTTITGGGSDSEGPQGIPGDDIDRPRKNKWRSKMGQISSINWQW